MILRLGGGDLNALFGIAGFAGGIGFGTIFLKKGYSLQRTYALSKLESAMMPATSSRLARTCCNSTSIYLL